MFIVLLKVYFYIVVQVPCAQEFTNVWVSFELMQYVTSSLSLQSCSDFCDCMLHLKGNVPFLFEVFLLKYYNKFVLFVSLEKQVFYFGIRGELGGASQCV